MESPAQTTIVDAMHQIPCGNCGQLAASTRRFCGTCGSRLWEPCLKCGTHNSVAERFCSNCGSDLHASLEAAVGSLDQRLARSAALEQEGKLLEAAESLAELPESDHSLLAPWLKAASDRRAELLGQREQIVAQRNAVIEEAQRLRSQRQYAAAHAVLERVPASLRDQQMRSLLADVAEALEQIKGLRRQLRLSLKDGQFDDLLASTEELLQLEPAAEDVRRLYAQLCQRRDERDLALAAPLLKQARDAIAGNDYVRAETCLKKIAAAIEKLGDEQRELLAAIEERVWLAGQLRSAPYIDKAILNLASRLAKLQPQDDKARKLHEEMAARLSRADTRVQPVYIPWRRPSGESVLGAPVEPVGQLAELHWDAANPKLSSWTNAVRRHLVAAGLALHGVGASRLDLELKQKTGATWLNRLTDARPRRAAPAAWGLDFGTSGLKAVRLVRDKNEIAVDASEIIAYSASTVGTGVPDVQPYFAAALEKFLEQCSRGKEPLVVGFPGAQSLGRFFRLPGMGAKKVRAALEFEVANQIPLPLDQVVHASHVWEQPQERDPREWLVALVAAKKAHVDLRVGPFAESHARVGSLQCECVALLNLMFHTHRLQIETLQVDEALVLVEVGDGATQIVAISRQRGPWFRTLYRGIRSLNGLLVVAFGITWQQADELRQNWSLSRSMAEVDKVLAPGFEQLTRELRQALKFCQQALGCRIRSIYLAGGGCEQLGLLREWSQSDDSRQTSLLCPGDVATALVDESSPVGS